MLDRGEFQLCKGSAAVAGAGRAVMSCSQMPLLPVFGASLPPSRLPLDFVLLLLLRRTWPPEVAGVMLFAAGDGGRSELMGCSSTVVDEEAMMTWEMLCPGKEAESISTASELSNVETSQQICQEEGRLSDFIILPNLTCT